jgi:hypothetical protein
VEKKRFKHVYGLAWKLYGETAAGFANMAELRDEESMLALKTACEEHMDKCLWIALYGTSQLDKGWLKLEKRLTMKGK